MHNLSGTTDKELAARIRAVSWRKALAAITGPALRLHHYRETQTQLLRNAFCQIDCRKNNNPCDDE
jgi:hypothetical protein